MTPDAVLSSDAQPTPAALPLQAEVEVGIAQIETELASIAAEDTRPWLLDHSDDEWHSSGAVGSSAFARRAHRSPLLTADDECALARRIEAAAFAGNASPRATSSSAPSGAVPNMSFARAKKPASR